MTDIPDSGFFEIDPPYWIDGYNNRNYKMLEKDSECTTDKFTVNTRFTGFNAGKFRLFYDEITVTNLASTGFTIECTNFRNPTY